MEIVIFSPSGQFSKKYFIMYIGKFIYIEIANILGITFPLSLHKLVHFINILSFAVHCQVTSKGITIEKLILQLSGKLQLRFACSLRATITHF